MAKKEVHMKFRVKDPLVVGDKVFITANVRDLTENELERARIELGETDEKKEKYLQELKRRLSREGNNRLDDGFLLRFLRVRKYDLEKAYQSVKKHYDNRKKHPELYAIPYKMGSLKIFDAAACLPYADEEGSFTYWGEIGCWNPQEESATDGVQLINCLIHLITTNPHCQINGVMAIFDMKGFGIRQAAAMLRANLMFVALPLAFLSTPIRIKKILVLNANSLFRFIYSLARTVLNKKTTDRFILLGSDLKELHKHVDPEILPKKLDGKLEDEFCRNHSFFLDNIPYLEYDKSFTGD